MRLSILTATTPLLPRYQLGAYAFISSTFRTSILESRLDIDSLSSHHGANNVCVDVRDGIGHDDGDHGANNVCIDVRDGIDHDDGDCVVGFNDVCVDVRDGIDHDDGVCVVGFNDPGCIDGNRDGDDNGGHDSADQPCTSTSRAFELHNQMDDVLLSYQDEDHAGHIPALLSSSASQSAAPSLSSSSLDDIKSFNDVLAVLYTPNTYEEAMDCEDTPLWIRSMRSELGSMETQAVWAKTCATSPPNGQHTLGARWVFKVDHKSADTPKQAHWVTVDLPDGTYLRYKSRIVVLGCQQIHGVDYKDTFAPAVRPDTLRAVLGLSLTDTT